MDILELKREFQTYKEKINGIKQTVKLEEREKTVEELEKKTTEDGFWNDKKESQSVIKKINENKDLINEYKQIENMYHDEEVLIEFVDMGEEDFVAELEEKHKKLAHEIDTLDVKLLLDGKYDGNNAIITIHSGAGGTEACDWVDMLYRMYSRWFSERGYKVSQLDFMPGDSVGIKSITLLVEGVYAYGYLKAEKGVHRLVRISPFNAAGKRQTSFVSCDVMPDINQDIDIEINDDDLRIDTYRSSGAGGQHINKTSSAIRITHLPTGIVVQCQNERSQHQNKDKAMQMLKAKLYLLKEAENAENLSGIRGDVKDINFGSQIRSYVLQPYTMVKDNRTNKEVANAGSVLDGNIDPFINAYLSANTEQASEQ